MKKALILGGGVAGLTAASYLVNKGVRATLIESSPKLGGRASSFFYEPENVWLDNGQHILMGCYKYTLDFIRLIGAEKELEKSESLEIPFVDSEGFVHLLSADGGFYPFNLLKAISKFTLLSKYDRKKLRALLLKLRFIKGKNHRNETAFEFLRKRQSDSAIKRFWTLVIASVFNAGADKISAEIFIETMKTVFLSGKNSSNIYLPKNSLNDLFSVPARKFIEKNGGKILTSERVEKFILNGNKITEVITTKNRYFDFDFVISALPFDNLVKILSEKYISNIKSPFTYSPIVSTHLIMSDKRLKRRYYGFENSEIDWIFNKKKVISVVKSNAFGLVKLTKSDIKQAIIKELSSKIKEFDEKTVKTVKIVKERKATLIISAETEAFRRSFDVNLTNFALIGDWTNTKLPSTIESAVKSGFLVSEK